LINKGIHAIALAKLAGDVPIQFLSAIILFMRKSTEIRASFPTRTFRECATGAAAAAAA